MKTIDEIYSEAAALPSDQKMSLAHRLITSTEPPESESLEAVWDFEIQERIKRFDQGRTTARPASEVFAELDHRLGK